MKPLAGLKVIDLSRILAGPWAGQILADLGADVIKIERAGAGDDSRGWGPPFVPAADGGHLGATYYHSTNRGKRSVAIDFDKAEDLARVRKLIAGADIVIENFKVGGLKKYGLDYASVSAENPKLIYCSVTGFGQTGPYAHRPGYDAMIQAAGGLMSIGGEPGGESMKTGVPIADLMTGVYAAVGILAALHERTRSGKGAVIDMSLLDTQVGMLANQAISYLVSGKLPERHGNAHGNLVPYQVFPASDGEVMIAVGNDEQFRRLCSVLDLADLGADPRYQSNEGRVRNREPLIAALRAGTGKMTKGDLLKKVEAAGVPVGPINSIAEVFDDPQVKARGMRTDLPSPASASGSVPTVRLPILINGAPLVAERASPQLGEHTAEVLKSIS